MRHVLAIVLWLLAWILAGFIPAAFFAARDGKTTLARTWLAIGLLGGAGFAIAGAVIW